METGSWLWLFVVFGGAVVLGLAIAWGMARSGRLTAQQKMAREEGTQRVYDEEEHKA